MAGDHRYRLLLTGASGVLGRYLAPLLAEKYGTLLMSDIADFPDPLPPGAQFVRADLADASAVNDLTKDVTTILHFGGVSTEQSFEAILPANIIGTTNIFEAARRSRGRVVFASSNHTIGFYERGEMLTVADRCRPDGLYGVSKVYGEMLGRLFYDKHGVESIHLRIGSCFPEPTEARHLSTWLSYGDFLRLISCSIEAEKPGFSTIWGVSANRQSWWGEDDAARIGYVPVDNAETYRASLSASTEDPIAARFQGGSFCAAHYSRGSADAAQ